jgi:hypothetical protein
MNDYGAGFIEEGITPKGNVKPTRVVRKLFRLPLRSEPLSGV